MQRADRAGIKVSDETLNNALHDVAERNKHHARRDLPHALAAQGIDYASYRENMRKELTMQILRQRDVSQRINVSPREIDQFLERQKKMPSESNEYNISHILIAVPQAATPEQLDEADQEGATTSTKRAAAGEDFARLAVAYSNARPRSKAARSAGARARSCRRSSPKSIVEHEGRRRHRAVRTPTGFHIVKLNDMRGADGRSSSNQMHARHILIKPNELQDDATVQQKLVGDPRPHPQQGRGLRGRRLGGLRRPGLRRRRRRPGLGRSRHASCPSSRSSSRSCSPTRSASRSARSSAGTSSSCWAAAQFDTTEDMHAPAGVPARCARARPTKKPSCGCAACATRRTSSTSSEADPSIAVTAGEPAGIGPDLCLALAARSLAQPRSSSSAIARCWPSARACSASTSARPLLRRAPPPPRAGRLARARRAARRALRRRAGSTPPTRATCSPCSTAPSTARRSGEFDAMVTAPVQKSVINDAGMPFTGHTEYLAERTRRGASGDAAGGRHAARRARHDAPAAARGQRRDHAAAARHDAAHPRTPTCGGCWGIARPRIAVCGLNPHAGESGHLGTRGHRRHRARHRSARARAGMLRRRARCPPTRCSCRATCRTTTWCSRCTTTRACRCSSTPASATRST